MNLLEETKHVLKENGKSLKDVKWIGCKHFTVSIENFVFCANKEYDKGFGAQRVATDIVVVGDDWWLERHEYDGSEWWEYKELPQKPSEEKQVKRVIGGMWSSLEELNGGDFKMTREEAIQILSTRDAHGVLCGYTSGVTEALDMAIEALSAKTVQGWIPCSERLPEEEKKAYWVCTDTECQCECRWTNNRFGIGEGKWGWSIFDTPQYTKPIAWMPLPEPYKGGNEK